MTRPVHFEILADDLDAAAAFYEQALGWTTNRWGGQPYVLVTTGPDDEPGINGGIMNRHFPQRVIVTSEVADLAATVKRVEEAGGTLAHGPNEIPNVGTVAYFTDPEGNMFGCIEPPNTQAEPEE